MSNELNLEYFEHHNLLESGELLPFYTQPPEDVDLDQ